MSDEEMVTLRRLRGVVAVWRETVDMQDKEIERLRAALRRIRDEYWPVMDDVKYQSQDQSRSSEIRDLCVAIEEAKEALGDE